MAGSQPPETHGFDGNDESLSGLIASIEDIFTLILETLVQEIDSIDDPESDALAALWKARFVAERGLRTSERLAECLRTKSGSAGS